MKNKLPLLLLLAVFACSQSKKQDDKGDSTKTDTAGKADTEQSSGLTFTKAPESPSYPEASLTKASVTTSEQESGKFQVQYDFEVANYELGVQTEDADTRGIANSGKGQHIHFIVNNGPYAAHYMDDISDELEPGNYVVLAFLSRSYHESVKSAGAYFIENLNVGDVEAEEADLSTPHMFFSRPKGTYSGEDAKKVMLDFFLVNCTLSPEGYNVKATINGKEFLIDEWVPYYMEDLPMGENTIRLELIDAEGNTVDSPFNPVERTVTLTADAS